MSTSCLVFWQSLSWSVQCFQSARSYSGKSVAISLISNDDKRPLGCSDGAGGFGAIVGAGAGVGCTAVGGLGAVVGAGAGVDCTAVGGNDVGGTLVGFEASGTGGGCFCVLGGSSAGVVPHPIAMTDTSRSQISFMTMSHLCAIASYHNPDFVASIAKGARRRG